MSQNGCYFNKLLLVKRTPWMRRGLTGDFVVIFFVMSGTCKLHCYISEWVGMNYTSPTQLHRNSWDMNDELACYAHMWGRLVAKQAYLRNERLNSLPLKSLILGVYSQVPKRIFCRSVSGLVNCPCGVWCRRWISGYLYVDPIFDKPTISKLLCKLHKIDDMFHYYVIVYG